MARELVVPQGATMLWLNQNRAPHNVVADSSAFRSELLTNGQRFSSTFAQLGTYAYFCMFHGGPGGQGMAGVVKVGDAAQPAPAPAPAAAQPTVSIKDFAFEPAELRIKAGQSVLWKNDGEKRHSATAVDGSFDTGLFGKGESKSVQFNLPGTFVYFCQLHGAQDGKSGMVATIIVE